MSLIYTGIGSRTTPDKIQHIMFEIGEYLGVRDWILRSGGANGADKAFEEGCDAAEGKKEIYLPWENFNHNKSPLHEPTLEALELAYEYHPNPLWLRRTNHTRWLMARNSHQVLGQNLQVNTRVVICWTQDGAESAEETSGATGGTGQAIRIASAYNIPIFNLKNKGVIDKIVVFINALVDNQWYD